MIRALLLFIVVTIQCRAQSVIYISESLPTFNYLFDNDFCYTAEDFSLFGDTTLIFTLYPEFNPGYLYYSYSSVGGFISNIEVEQYANNELVSIDRYVFPDYDTLLISFHVTGVGIESFCPFFVPINPLPVSWGNITVLQNGNFIETICETTSETNSWTLNLEVSKDLMEWKWIGQRQMLGQSSLSHTYNFRTDVMDIRELFDVNSGNKSFSSNVKGNTVIAYFRMKQVDLNGEYIYSEIIPVPVNLIGRYSLPKMEEYDYSGRFLGFGF